MGDELELLGRMVQGCGTVGGTGEGVRVDDDEAIDMVGMREECDGAPIPGKEYQQQRSIYPFRSIIAGKITTIHDIRQSQESGISKVHSLNRQSVGYYSTRSETAISSFLRKAFGKVADTRPLRMIASSAVRQLPTETLK